MMNRVAVLSLVDNVRAQIILILNIVIILQTKCSLKKFIIIINRNSFKWYDAAEVRYKKSCQKMTAFDTSMM